VAEVTDGTPASPRIPVATYRLQFNATFTFRDARAIIPYLAALGISDCYASSYLRAVPGSGHGYDIADPTSLNPEIGSDEDYWAWIHALRQAGMGHILDVVPNHMGIARSANPWWMDVLENGPSSRYARFFDIEWKPIKDELADKVLLPILGDYYGAVLEDQQLALDYRNGAFVVRYHDDWLPIAPDTYPRILHEALSEWPGNDADMDELRSIITAAGNLPPRASTDPHATAVRSREKEIVKRRLAALVGRSAGLAAAVDRALRTFNGAKGQPRSFDRLDALLGEQSYRLSDWHVASEEINYRRFFDVNQLAALRVEDPVVFDEVHAFVLELLARGAATGLRIDHVDGLFSPADYLRRLQARATDLLDGAADAAGRAVYLVVEKILGADEQLVPDWPVHGTTGYEFSAVLTNLFVDRRHERAMDEIYRRFLRARSQPSFDDIAYQSRKQIVHATMSGDINALGHQLNRLSERNRHYRDFTLYSLIAAIKELVACFPVYRTYIAAGDDPNPHDRRYIARAVRCANRRAQGPTSRVFDFVQRVLLKQTLAGSREECEERAGFIGKFQQMTSPVAAKGIEDTACYVYNRLVSLNEVGGDPTRFGLSPSAVHAWMCARQRQWPAALSTTSTHDTKRGEDVRARLNVLSEMPDAWKAAVTRWRALNRRFRADVDGVEAPDPNDEYFLYQTVVGAWPFTTEGQAAFPERLKQYMVKAMREAKQHTSWINPNEPYEAAVRRFIDDLLDRRRPFLQAFLPFQSRVAELGIYNSLAQLLVKITAPGVPDFYQGTELWDLSLVDPDNRRPVDYVLRERLLRDVLQTGPAVLLDQRADGRVKMFVMIQALRQRAALRDVFDHGRYVPLSIEGSHADHLFAFARRLGELTAITCVPRLVAGLCGDRRTPPIGPEVWGDTRIMLPASGGDRERVGLHDQEARLPHAFRDAISGRAIEPRGGGEAMWIDTATVLEQFPVALLVPVS
jgi:(1->4)-alpha-D-glucan 1-alpha-D-glucosylmutase